MLEVNEFLRTYWPIVAFVATALLAGGGALMLRTFVTKEELKLVSETHNSADVEIHKRITDYDRTAHKRISLSEKEIAVIQEAIKNMPTQRDFKDIHGGMESLTASFQGLKDAVTGMGSKVDMLIENELKGEKK